MRSRGNHKQCTFLQYKKKKIISMRNNFGVPNGHVLNGKTEILLLSCKMCFSLFGNFDYREDRQCQIKPILLSEMQRTYIRKELLSLDHVRIRRQDSDTTLFTLCLSNNYKNINIQYPTPTFLNESIRVSNMFHYKLQTQERSVGEWS